MRYLWQHIQTLTDAYDGSLPLAHVLKQYCRQHPMLGSRDRKILSEMAYCWYRCSKGFDEQLDFEQKMVACLHLCGNIDVVGKLLTGTSYESLPFNIEQLFPVGVPLSEGVARAEWLGSMLHQPMLFIRVRKDRQRVEAILNEHNIAFAPAGERTLALPNGAAIDKLLPEELYVVQDASSQKTGEWFNPRKGEQWYDCCSGAGGKSLLLKDMEPGVKLSVSDIRDTILHNLRERFRKYGHQPPVSYVTNVSDADALARSLKGVRFDNIISDVPCTGSGTWARTPEQMYFFKTEEIDRFGKLQLNIATNVAEYLKPGGRLIYITCSVFEQENMGVVRQLMQRTGLRLQEAKLINGIEQRADSMFIAVLEQGK